MIVRITLYCLIFTVLYHPALFGQYDGIKVLSSTPRKLIINYQPQNYSIHSLKAQNKSGTQVYYKEIEIPQSTVLEVAGFPQIPYKIIKIGIPANGSYTVSVASGQPEDVKIGRLLPGPQIIPHAIGYESIYEEGPVYKQSSYYPTELYKAEKPSFIRNQKILTLILYPVQYNPKLETIRFYKKIKVTVTFSIRPSANRQLVKFDNYFEDVYKDVILNYETAKEWRVHKKSGLRRFKRTASSALDLWYKIVINEDGLYQVDYEDLAGVGIVVPTAQSIHLYTGSGKELSRSIIDSSAVPQDSLREVSLYLSSQTDFKKGDYFLFYGYGLSGWEYDTTFNQYSYYKNHYSDANIYWLKIDNTFSTKQMSLLVEATDQNPSVISETRDRIREEKNQENPWKSAYEWYWASTSSGFKRNFPSSVRSIEYLNKTNDVYLKINLLKSNSASVTINNVDQGITTSDAQLTIPGSLLNAGLQQNTISVTSSDNHLNWFELVYWRYLKASNNEISFSTDTIANVAYSISNFTTSSPLWIFDLTDRYGVSYVQKSPQSGTLTMQIKQNGYRKFNIFDPTLWKTVTSITREDRPNLLVTAVKADYLILTPSEFSSEAEVLANFRRSHNNFLVKKVFLQDIYNEFSAGRFDPTAIRDFITYTGTWDRQPEFVIFIGDGHYDYKNYLNKNAPNWFPPFEGNKQLLGTTIPGHANNVCTDDFYLNYQGNMFNGRLPVNNKSELAGVIRKIIDYETETDFTGGWNNRFVLVADDEVADKTRNETYHTKDAEDLSTYIIPRSLNIEKIYLTEYQLDAKGAKPGSNEAFLEAFNRGCLIIDYMGHGSPDKIAHEGVFQFSKDKSRIQNGKKRPAFIAVTCSGGTFDDMQQISMAEGLMLMEYGGSILSLAGTRVTYGNKNKLFNMEVVGSTLTKDPIIGRVILNAKIKLNHLADDNYKVYTLFGDPALKLQIPPKNVVIDSVYPDTFKALSTITVAGHVEKDDGTSWTGYSGNVYLESFDAVKNVKYTNEESGIDSLKYILPGGALYRGTGEIKDGRFTMKFIVPKDISYNRPGGRITADVYSAQGIAVGLKDSIFIGGSSQSLISDLEGPTISLRIKNFSTERYSNVNKSPIIVATLEDQSGINLTGASGHSIVLVVDNNLELTHDVTASFAYDKDSFTKGSLEYPLFNLISGEHTVRLKGWDNLNNSSIADISFTVISNEKLLVLDPLNYPNPFKKSTTISYRLSREADDVDIKIYTVSGKLITHIENAGTTENINFIDWTANDEYGSGLANGTYMYVITAEVKSSGLEKKDIKAKATGFAVIMR